MRKLIHIFLIFIAIAMMSCDSKNSPNMVIVSTPYWVLTRVDSITILCVPRFDNDSIKPFIIKTNNNEIN